MAHSLCRVAKALKGEVTHKAAWQQEQGQWWRLPYTPKYRQVSLALGMGYGQHLWRALLTLRGRKGRIFSGSIPHAFRTVQLASMVWKQLSWNGGSFWMQEAPSTKISPELITQSQKRPPSLGHCYGLFYRFLQRPPLCWYWSTETSLLRVCWLLELLWDANKRKKACPGYE